MLVERYTDVASVAIDQSGLREAELARRVAEAASQNKSEFVAALSHDIRAPLQTIVGLTEMLRSVDMPAERRQQALDLVARAAGHITDLVDDVLDLARIEAGALPMRMSEVDIGDLLAEVGGLLSPLAQPKGVDVEVCASDATVRADSRRLRQVLMNLATNAVLHNDDDGWVRLSAVESDVAVVITVSDAGPGIPADRLDRLFVPFDRLGADDRDTPGSGLGLPLALRLTEAMGGSLTIHSQQGTGTTAEVRLPR